MRYVTCILVLCALALAGAWGPASAAGRRIAPLDTLQVRVASQPELDTQARVSPDGTVSIPYVGRFRAAGLTEDEVAQRITSALVRANVVKDAQVSVQVTGFGAQVSVAGAVRSPGNVQLDRPTTVLETISRAGGLVQPGGAIIIQRQARRGTQVIRLDSQALLNGSGPNPLVQDGDKIVAEETPVFYLYGYVNRPGAYPLLRALSVQQALASGGGLSELGSEWRIRIKRRAKDGSFVTQSATLDDPVLPNDTIIVNERWF